MKSVRQSFERTCKEAIPVSRAWCFSTVAKALPFSMPFSVAPQVLEALLPPSRLFVCDTGH